MFFTENVNFTDLRVKFTLLSIKCTEKYDIFTLSIKCTETYDIFT